MEFLNITEEAEKFLEEWNDSGPYITAHTSGSTGSPKPIKLLKTDLTVSAEATCRFFGIDRGDRLLCPLSAGYIAGKMMIVRAIVADADLIFETPSKKPLKKDYGRIRLLPIVPSQLAGIDVTALRSVDNLLIGGAPLSPEQEKYAAELPCRAFASYGMTETASHIALREIGKEDFFTALPGVSFETDDYGCLKLILPDFSFRELQTNDMVELLSDKRFRWIGRKDNVVISGGLKLHPELIEKKICDHIGAPFYLIGEDDDEWGQKLVLYVEGPSVPDMENKLRKILEGVEMPKSIRYVSAFSRTESGKIKRKLL